MLDRVKDETAEIAKSAERLFWNSSLCDLGELRGAFRPRSARSRFACHILLDGNRRACPTMRAMNPYVTVVDHPLVASQLTILRDKVTVPEEFRRKMQELSALLLFEASRTWKLRSITVQTPLEPSAGSALRGPVAMVPILRAGLGMLEGMLRILPEAGVGHIGLYRDEITLRPVNYYCRLPTNLAAAEVLLLDPMLATGHSACEAVAMLKKAGARSIQFVCLLACAAGIEQLQGAHPDVRIITAAIDPELNEHGYIVPGLGDAGDRYFGTG